MEKNKLSKYGYTLFRVGIPALMLLHGSHKLEMLMAGGEIKFMDFLGLGTAISLALAVIGELVAPLFLIVGFKTRRASIPAIITMFVAVFVAHAGEPLEEREHSLLYLIAFIAIAMIGSGAYSVDAWIQSRKNKS
ncbi:MAG: DoxX family protein [Bacteroidota bacterium]